MRILKKIHQQEKTKHNGMNYESLQNQLDKAENRPVRDEKEWDREMIGKNLRDSLEKYDTTLDKEDPDDALAERLYAAGMELAAKTGGHCIDTERRISWTEEELRSILSAMPDKSTLGIGEDSATIKRRRPDEDSHIVINGGPFGIPVSEELYIPFHEAIAMKDRHDFLQ